MGHEPRGLEIQRLAACASGSGRGREQHFAQAFALGRSDPCAADHLSARGCPRCVWMMRVLRNEGGIQLRLSQSGC